MNKKEETKLKLAITINILNFVLMIFASIIMFTGIKITNGVEPELESTKLGMFKFFTVDSNMFVGIVSLIMAIKQIEVLKGKVKEVAKKYYILKYMGTSAVFLTFFVVFAYLGPISKGGIMSMLQNSNIFFHLVIPVLAIISFVFLEKTNNISKKEIVLGIIPNLLYGLFYLTNVLIHTENGFVSPEYDWYYLAQNGIQTAFISAPVMQIIGFGLSFVLWKLNKIRTEEK